MNSIRKVGFGGSCHWCTEAIFQSLIGVENVLQGWISSEEPNTSFSEAVIISFNINQVSLKTLIEVHLHTHSCTANHSMRGKYRSSIYYFSDEHKEKSLEYLAFFQSDFEEKIITNVLPYVDFKINSESFLDYYYKNPEKPFCVNIINPKLKLILQKFSKGVNNEKLKHLI
jgi:peptide-methionine (S)-S-oxide reductase